MKITKPVIIISILLVFPGVIWFISQNAIDAIDGGPVFRAVKVENTDPSLKPKINAVPVPSANPDIEELISPSQLDTQVDGRLREDASGNLIIEIGIRDLFDYFFSALGEKSPEQIVRNLEQYIGSRLSPKAAAEARALLQRFVAYNHAVAELAVDDQTDMENLQGQALLNHLRAYQDSLADARLRHFGEEINYAFFSGEQQYQEFNIARLALGLSDLSDTEKQQQLKKLRSRLPESQQAIIQEHERMNEFKESEKNWQMAGLSGEELHNKRTEAYGVDAAKRMSALDEKRQVWQSRLHGYFDEMTKINASDLPESEKQYFIDDLKDNSFSETERLRVEVIETYRLTTNISKK